MNKYVIKTAYKMGEPHDTYGQTWYCQVEETQSPVMFNLLGDQEVQELDRVVFETQEIHTFKTGKNVGKEYRRLKKVKVEPGSPRNEPQLSVEERLTKLEEAIFGDTYTAPSGDKVIKDISDEPIDISEIPF